MHLSAPRLVGHYCDAKSFVPWNVGEEWAGMDKREPANQYHMLARGDSHLTFAISRFGTPCAALEERATQLAEAQVEMPIADNGQMGMGSALVIRQEARFLAPRTSIAPPGRI